MLIDETKGGLKAAKKLAEELGFGEQLAKLVKWLDSMAGTVGNTRCVIKPDQAREHTFLFTVNRIANQGILVPYSYGALYYIGVLEEMVPGPSTPNRSPMALDRKRTQHGWKIVMNGKDFLEPPNGQL